MVKGPSIVAPDYEEESMAAAPTIVENTLLFPFDRALVLLRKGAAVRRQQWLTGRFCFMRTAQACLFFGRSYWLPAEMYMAQLGNSEMVAWDIATEDVLAEDWEVCLG
jgi:hypothetical protein